MLVVVLVVVRLGRVLLLLLLEDEEIDGVLEFVSFYRWRTILERGGSCTVAKQNLGTATCGKANV